MSGPNRTHDPAAQSWVESANGHSNFPVQNLPFGVFRRLGAEEEPRVGVAIGDRIIDIAACRDDGLFKGKAFTAAMSCDVTALNTFMALGQSFWTALRESVFDLLCAHSPDRKDNEARVGKHLVLTREADMLMPVDIGDYTDFYASVFHATNVGSMFRPDNPLLPNYKWVPIAYHGRASSVQVSGTPVRRPFGQSKDDAADAPTFGPSKLLDYELEVGLFIGNGNDPGTRIAIDDAEARIFGLCLVNDWSARDFQKWEYQPLGPFLAKSFATTISPWIVTMEALEPFRAPEFERPGGDPKPLPYLDSPHNQEAGGIDLQLDVYLRTDAMRQSGEDPVCVSHGSFRDMYWTVAQMVTHHSSNGCNLRAGDLLASGTVSGKSDDSRGCLLELTSRGQKPITLPGGEERRFLQDGDEVIIRGYCEREGAVRIGLGECRAVITPAEAG